MLNAEPRTEVDQSVHNELIVDQFTRQAASFAQRHKLEESLQLMLNLSGVSGSDTVLDVACGPGIVSCAFAAVARHVTGIDLTPAMLEHARILQAERTLDNITWLQGDVSALPFPDNSFSVVVTRYTFHHFLSPETVLSEMVRVCHPGGCVLVADVTPETAKLSAYDHFETLRDPSHVHALSLDALRGLLARTKLRQVRSASFRLEMDFELLLSGSFPNPGEADWIRQWIHGDLGKDHIGLGVHLKDDRYFISFPITIVAAEKSIQEG